MLQCWRRTRHLPSFFVPTSGDLTAQESPPLGICHPRQKNANARGSARRGGGGGAKQQLELSDALHLSLAISERKFYRKVYNIRDFKQITMATSTTAAGSKEAQKRRSAYASKWPCTVAPNPTTWRPVFWRSRYYVGTKVDFSPSFFLVDGFKTYHRLFFSLSRKYLRLLALQ